MSQSVYQFAAEIARTPNETANTTYQFVAEIARNVDQFLYVTGAIGNHRIDGHVISMRRYSSLCNPGQHISLQLDASFVGPTVPGTPCVIYERGVKVLTGYVMRWSRTRPSYEWQVDIDDTYQRVMNYFIPERLEFPDPSSSFYLIRTILEPTLIDYEIHGMDVATPPGLVLGLRTAHDALQEVLPYGSWYCWVDENGKLIIKKHIRTQPIVIRDPIRIEDSLDTEQTRNVVKVYGSQCDPAIVNYQDSRGVDGLIVDLTTVVANPLITRFDDAARVADYLLSEMGSLTHRVSFEIEGDPSLQIGTSGSLYYQDPVSLEVTSGSGPITALETHLDHSGYTTVVTVGERCPRISGWSVDPNTIRALWVNARGGVGDARMEKLIWSGDFGMGGYVGQPTWNIVKTIPEGTITGMHVTRDGSIVYLIMMTTETIPWTSPPVSADCYRLWKCIDPYTPTPEWTYIMGSGDGNFGDTLYFHGEPSGSIRSDGIDSYIDFGAFGINAFGSAQMVGNTLYLTYRLYKRNRNTVHEGYAHTASAIDKNGATPAGSTAIIDDYLRYIGGDSTQVILISSMGTKNAYFRPYDPGTGTIRMTFWKTAQLTYSWYWNMSVGFDLPLMNGVARIASDYTTRGNIWCNDKYVPVTSDLYYVVADMPIIAGGTKNNQSPFSISGISLSSNPVATFRGDYFGTQVQIIDDAGNLFVAQDGSSFAKKFTWTKGIAVCLDAKIPTKMAWLSNDNLNANEVARITLDGGTTWSNMTGNWWGSNSEVLAGTKMQSVGSVHIMDAHPTFWPSELTEV